eukprot:gene17859-12803_t
MSEFVDANVEPTTLEAEESVTNRPRFCVIDTDCSKAWNPITFSDMFRTCFELPGDAWITCHIAVGDELPADLLSYQGVVLTGSRFNCRDNLPWFAPLCQFIRDAAQQGTPRIYGGCFGCQLIAHALGGEVDYNPDKRFILKAEDIKWCACHCSSSTPHSHDTSNSDDTTTTSTGCPCCQALPWASDVIRRLQSTGLQIIVSHGDCVRKVPEQALLIANSSSCGAEMFVAGRHWNIFASQSHPEMEYDYCVRDRIWPVVVEQRQRLSDEEVAIARASFARYTGEDAKLFMAAIRAFLHSSSTASS